MTPPDEPRNGPDGDVGPVEGEAPDAPPPSTYAGRQRQSPPAPEGDGAAGQAPTPASGGTADEPPSTPAPGDTVEVDTLAFADREEAKEAALRGLKARAAAHSTKTHALLREAARPVPPPTPPGQEPAPAVPVGAGAQAAPADGEPPAAEAPKPAAAAPPPRAPAPATAVADVGPPPKRWTWARFLAGAVVIVATVAAATAVSGLLGFYDIAKSLGGIPIANNLLADADPSGPQTILIIGSDKRPHEGDYGRSDTTILLHIASDGISFMSIPRDLKVDIPGYGENKFNAAYTDGGPSLTTKVVTQLTGVKPNHVVNVNFTGFADAVNAIDCVYYDVDHHYYHSNYGLPVSEQYAEIDIKAGYQLMCGYKALQFVRYRHDDNDIVRSARQQAFLREIRGQIPATTLLSRFNRLVRIFGKYTSSDEGLRSLDRVLGLAKLLLAARNAPMHEVHFPAILGGPTDPYVTAQKAQIHHAVRQFLGETSGPASAGASGAPARTSGATAGGSKAGRGGSSGGGSGSAAPAPAPLIDATTSGQDYAAQLNSPTWHRRSKLPIYYPTRVAPGSELTSDSRSYPIDGPGSSVYYGYTFVAAVPTEGYTAYYDFTGTNWNDPPILDNPSETKDIDGREYELFWDSGRLRLVAWKTSKGSYWVDNDLGETLTPGQMMGMAEGMREYTG